MTNEVLHKEKQLIFDDKVKRQSFLYNSLHITSYNAKCLFKSLPHFFCFKSRLFMLRKL